MKLDSKPGSDKSYATGEQIALWGVLGLYSSIKQPAAGEKNWGVILSQNLDLAHPPPLFSDRFGRRGGVSEFDTSWYNATHSVFF